MSAKPQAYTTGFTPKDKAAYEAAIAKVLATWAAAREDLREHRETCS